ncbi:MAG TPA: MotA/TolQ/ExbB proton channel family protein [Noviherbaspirillum sp.]|nr:MotA/TolQ/ExbB proton channel family protein [Noviherbaspirillum sp.]
MNNFSIAHVWIEGDFVSRTVAVILVAMSLLSWTIIVAKLWQQAALRRMAETGVKGFWRSHSLVDGMSLLGTDREANPFRALAEDGVSAAQHHAQNRNELQGALNPSEWLMSTLRGTLEEIGSRLQRGLPVLASVGSTAPFIGLFGTVWGIYHALAGISAAGQASIDKVAGPVGEALIMTALGLAVAIPAVLGYNALLRGNRAFQVKLNRFTQDLHAYLLTGTRVGQQTSPPKLAVTGG